MIVPDKQHEELAKAADKAGERVSDALAKLLVSGCIEAAPARARRGAAKEK